MVSAYDFRARASLRALFAARQEGEREVGRTLSPGTSTTSDCMSAIGSEFEFMKPALGGRAGRARRAMGQRGAGRSAGRGPARTHRRPSRTPCSTKESARTAAARSAPATRRRRGRRALEGHALLAALEAADGAERPGDGHARARDDDEAKRDDPHLLKLLRAERKGDLTEHWGLRVGLGVSARTWGGGRETRGGGRETRGETDGDRA